MRVLAATNRDLKAIVKEKRLRDDLFYQLNVIPVPLPLLRQRPHDNVVLTNYYLRKNNTITPLYSSQILAQLRAILIIFR